MKPKQIVSLDPYDWTEILSESQSEGHHMVSRLLADFRSGSNRFDAPGEALFVHVSDNAVVAVAGLNREKDSTFGRAGRIRRLYVIPKARGSGLGRCLVETLICSAGPHFDVLTVNAGTPDAAGFYEHLGFKPVHHPGITHTKELPAIVKQAQSPAEIEDVRRLLREYAVFLGVDLFFQGFEDEVAGLPGKYALPNGTLLIATKGDRVAGCVALRALGDGVCEMKRLFVRAEYRGAGLGKLLASEVIEVARTLGYSLMRLDTLDRLTAAMRLYESLGFRKTTPYYENPIHGVVYWELNLKAIGSACDHIE